MTPETKARNAVTTAIRTGVLVREPCVVNGCVRQGKTDAHHPDYSKPLEVVWLCRLHHMLIHREGWTVEQLVDHFDRAACEREMRTIARREQAA